MKQLFFLFIALTLVGAGCFPSAQPTDQPVNGVEDEAGSGNGDGDGIGSGNGGNSGDQQGEEAVADDRNVILTSPTQGQTVSSPIVLRGRARVFENSLSYRILQGGSVLKEGHFMYAAEDVGMFGNFEHKVFLPAMDSTSFTVEVFNYSAKDGEMENVERVNVQLESTEKTSLNVFFVDPDVMANDCSAVEFEKRTVAKTMNVAEAALLELLEGPKSDWAVSQIPSWTRLESISLKDGVATVHFSSPGLEGWNGGSCHVTALYAQIHETLTQFPTIDSIEVKVNGESEEIFQP